MCVSVPNTASLQKERPMNRKWTIVFVLAASAVLVATGSYAAKLNVGNAAPDWSGIIGVDDKKHSLSDY